MEVLLKKYFIRNKNRKVRHQNESIELYSIRINMKYLKYINLIFAIAFIGFAAVQLNDPDSGLWMAAYMSAALVSILSFSGKISKKVLLGLIGVSAFSILAFLPNAYSSIIEYDPNFKSHPAITHLSSIQAENVFEVSGLIVIFVALVFQYFTVRKFKTILNTIDK